jgi:hypothetical protein
LLEAAVREGAEVVGGIDPSTLDGDAEGQLDCVFGIADRLGAKIDIHLHEPDMQGVEQLARIAARTKALGLAGRVAVSHAYALGDVGQQALDQVARQLADAGVAIMTNAPGDRAFPPALRLREAGVRMFAGNDNIQDTWWPYGNGDMLQRAMLIGYRSGFYTDGELLAALDMASHAGAAVLAMRPPSWRCPRPTGRRRSPRRPRSAFCSAKESRSGRRRLSSAQASRGRRHDLAGAQFAIGLQLAPQGMAGVAEPRARIQRQVQSARGGETLFGLQHPVLGRDAGGRQQADAHSRGHRR